MIIFKSINKLNKEVNFKADIGFVPTMGALHQGHLSLIKNSQKKSNKTGRRESFLSSNRQFPHILTWKSTFRTSVSAKNNAFEHFFKSFGQFFLPG